MFCVRLLWTSVATGDIHKSVLHSGEYLCDVNDAASWTLVPWQAWQLLRVGQAAVVAASKFGSLGLCDEVRADELDGNFGKYWHNTKRWPSCEKLDVYRPVWRVALYWILDVCFGVCIADRPSLLRQNFHSAAVGDADRKHAGHHAHEQRYGHNGTARRLRTGQRFPSARAYLRFSLRVNVHWEIGTAAWSAIATFFWLFFFQNLQMILRWRLFSCFWRPRVWTGCLDGLKLILCF